jgi:hypothetical protein
MPAAQATPEQVQAFRALVRRVVAGERASGGELDACRAVLQRETDSGLTFQALCMLLEGALADPTLPIDDTRLVVTLLKQLARGAVAPEQVL